MATNNLSYYDAKISSATGDCGILCGEPGYKIVFDIPEFDKAVPPKQLSLNLSSGADRKAIGWLSKYVFGRGLFTKEDSANIIGRMVTVGINDAGQVREINGLNFDEVFDHNANKTCDISHLRKELGAFGENPSLTDLMAIVAGIDADLAYDFCMPVGMKEKIKLSPLLDKD